jgi:hypothetical protein
MKGVIPVAGEDDLESLIACVAAEADHEADRRRQRRLYEAIAILEGSHVS